MPPKCTNSSDFSPDIIYIKNVRNRRLQLPDYPVKFRAISYLNLIELFDSQFHETIGINAYQFITTFLTQKITIKSFLKIIT